MIHPGPIFDLILMTTLITLAWLLLAGKDLFRAVVLFISFGLLTALAWVRLGAPDVALAEAAIGAGITGALLLVGLGKLGSAERCRRTVRPATALQRLTPAVLIAVIIPSVAVILLLELRQLKTISFGQQKLVLSLLDISGTDHPVTAVLLNFRAWDTLLEKGVLLLALTGIWSLDQAHPLFHQEPLSPVLKGLSQLYLPILIIVSGALLWQGSYAPGGAFQAGALLSAGILLAALGGRSLPSYWPGLPLRLLASCGLLVFLLVTALTLLTNELPLNYPQELAAVLILLIEIFATVAIAVILAAAVAGGHPAERHKHHSPSPEKKP
ncbi:MAG: hydrogenase subunit MbhD domain-containing protein [Pelovirga sp.]